MLTILFHMTIKPGRETDCAAMVKEVTESTRSQDEGCLTHTFYQCSDNPRELVLFEQWRDAVAMLEKLAKALGIGAQDFFRPPKRR